MVLHGWYSKDAAVACGTAIYETPDGREVEVTYVCNDDISAPNYLWFDKVYVGEVTRWISDGEEGEDCVFI